MSSATRRRLGTLLAVLATPALALLPLAAEAAPQPAPTPTAPASVGAYRPADRQPGPAPAAVASYYPVAFPQRQVLPSARIDTGANTVTLPLRRGRMADGRTVWYVITEASDPAVARSLRVNYSAKLGNAPGSATRSARWSGRGLIFRSGSVDFAPERKVVPGDGPHAFPPEIADPGSVGDADYSPLVRVGHVVLNATTVAFDVPADAIEFPNGRVDHDRVLDRVIAISPRRGTVTFGMSLATASGHPVLFVSLDSNSRLVSALEATTYAPRLAALPTPARSNARGSSVSANYIISNGPTGADNPQRQGLDSALTDRDGQVLDVFATVPGVVEGADYSPMWSLYVASWRDDAVTAGYRSVLHSELDVLGMAARGDLTSPDGSALAPSGLISNCPVLATF